MTKQLRINSWRKQIRSETTEYNKPKQIRPHHNAHHISKADLAVTCYQQFSSARRRSTNQRMRIARNSAGRNTR